MLKNTNKVFASSDFPIIAYSNGDNTKIRSYVCKDSNTVVLSNFSEMRPRSPITGNAMVPNVQDRYIRNLNKSDFDSLVNIATCPKCGKKLYTNKAIASVLDKAYCIHCGSELKIEDGKDYYSKMGELIDEIGSEIKQGNSTMKENSEVATAPVVEKSIDDTIDEVIKETETTSENSTMVESSVDALIDEVLAETEKEKDKDEEDDTESEEADCKKSDKLDKSDKKDKKVESAEEIEDIKVDMLSTVSSFNDLKVIPSGSENFHYIMANKKPVAMLHKFRAISAVADIFENLSTLENTLKESVNDKKGFTKEVVSSFGIVPIIMKIKSNKIIESKINKKVNEIQSNAVQTIADAENAYDQCLGIAASGINKEAFDDCNNILAQELIKKFENVGVEDAETLVKATFEAHANEYLLQVINKAKSIKDKSLEERNQIASAVINFDSKEGKITSSMMDNIKESEIAKEKESSDISEVLFGK